MISDATFYKNVKADIKVNEGCISHMYLDTKGLVTVGVGFMIPDVNAAQKYHFKIRDSDQNATAEDIARDFDNVKRQVAGRIAQSYKSATKLDLPDEEIDILLDQRIQEFESSLIKIFPNYPTYPASAKLGLIDMSFNLGIAGLTKKFPTFVANAKQENWRVCADECQRRGISDSRNEATKALFAEAENIV